LMKLDIAEEQAVESTNKEDKQSNYGGSKSNTQGNNTNPIPSGREGFDEAIRNSAQRPEKRQPILATPKVGRNEPCPCGSGKKFKQCHGVAK